MKYNYFVISSYRLISNTLEENVVFNILFYNFWYILFYNIYHIADLDITVN
jgi:hypothetical protein